MGLEQMGHRPIGVKLAMQCFDRAIRLDPELAEAYGAVAILWATFGIFLAVAPATALEKSNGYAKGRSRSTQTNASPWRP